MSKKTQAIESMPPQVFKVLEGLGRNLRLARKRRKISVAKLAQLALVSRNTVTRAEKGEPTVSIGVYASILYVLQLEGDLERIANPDKDDLGKTLSEEDIMGHLPSFSRLLRIGRDDDYNF